MHAVLSSLGTDGDIFPFIAIGAALRARGHRATLVTSGQYERVARQMGLDFEPLVSAEENRALICDPDFWHPIKGARTAARWVADKLPRQYEILASFANDPEVVLITNPAIVAARMLHDLRQTPLATVILQPWMIPSIHAPPVMPMGLTLPAWAPAPVGRLYYLMLDVAVGLLMGRVLNELGRKIGLAPVRRMFKWWFSPELVLAMFPKWFGQPQIDWAPQIRVTGFPMYDGQASPSLDEVILRFCQEGEPPIAFTFGTGMIHGRALFASSVDACRRLGARGILLTPHRQQLPESLPDCIRQCDFAPFQKLFPHCAAVVHHGGIGTAAKALAAGIAQLVIPQAYDQFDTAVRIKKLGVGDWIRPRHRSGEKIAAALRRLLTPDEKPQYAWVAEKDDGFDGLGRAADLLEALARKNSAGDRPLDDPQQF